MGAIDVVNRVFREFRRYTGDGLPGEPANAELPVGDPTSGVHNPKKSEIREALLAPIGEAQDAADRAEAAAAFAQAGAGPIEFDTRAAAMAYSPASAPTGIRLRGHSTLGDCGGGLYRKVNAEPSHAGKFSITLSTSALAWYELVDTPEVTVIAFGGLGNGSADNASAIDGYLGWAAATEGRKTLNFPGGEFYTTGEHVLPDNTVVRGIRGLTKIRGKLTSEGAGGYPNTVFSKAGGSDVCIEGIIFDFGKGSSDYADDAGLTTKPGLRFEGVDGVVLTDVALTNFVTNYNTDYENTADFINFSVMAVADCSNFVMTRVHQENIREEGPQFLNCRNVRIIDPSGNGAAVNTSSALTFWYCDGVNINGGDFVHTGGSIINCCSKNVLIDGLKVNTASGATQDGRGIDIGNELDLQAFDAENIAIVNCDLNVTQYGVFTQAGPSYIDETRNITIRGNRFRVSADGGTLWGIRLHGAHGAVVEENEIVLTDASATGQGMCIFLTDTGANNEDVSILRNRLRGLTGVYSLCNADSTWRGVLIEGNTFTSQDIGALSSANGASVFVYFRNNTAADFWDLRNIEIRGNRAYNLGGSPVVSTFDDPASVRVDSVFISDNFFEGPAGGRGDRPLQWGGSGVGGDARLELTNNKLWNCGGIRSIGLKDFLADRNEQHWNNGGGFGTERFNLTGHNGDVRMRENLCTGVTTAADDVNQSGGTFGMVDIRGNVARQFGATTLQWTKTAMPANTSLPN